MTKTTMMRTLLLVGSSTVMVSAQSVGDCQRNFRPAADPGDCSSIFQLARCYAVAGLDEMLDTSATRQAAEQFLLAQQGVHPACVDAVDPASMIPKIRTSRVRFCNLTALSTCISFFVQPI